MDNFIAQDVSSPNNVGQGLFPGDIKNSAFVRMDITTVGSGRQVACLATLPLENHND
jgi:hypothetical protein